MTTSQQPRYGRHARPDGEPARDVPSEPSAASLPVQRGAQARRLTVGEYAAGTRDDAQPGFGEWPYGPSRRDAAPEATENPYLPAEGTSSDVTLPPGGWPGTAAMVMGFAGVALAMAPITAVVVWPLTILGLVLGVLGVRRVRAGTARNGVTAVVGTVFCTAALAVCGAWIALYTMAGLNTAPPAQADTPTSQVR